MQGHQPTDRVVDAGERTKTIVSGQRLYGEAIRCGKRRVLSGSTDSASHRPECPLTIIVPTGPMRSQRGTHRSEEHTSELQSLMRISYAVFCLKKKKQKT